MAVLKREHRAGRVFLSNYRYHATPKVLLGCKATIKAPTAPRLASPLTYQRNRLVPFLFGAYRYRALPNLSPPPVSLYISLLPPFLPAPRPRDLSPLPCLAVQTAVRRNLETGSSTVA